MYCVISYVSVCVIRYVSACVCVIKYVSVVIRHVSVCVISSVSACAVWLGTRMCMCD